MGSNVSALLVPFCGWRTFTLILAAVGLVVGWFAWMKIPAMDAGNDAPKVDNRKGLKLFASNRNLWLVGLYGCMTYLPLSAIAELWGIPFLQNRFSVSTGAASVGAALIFIFFGLGSIGAAWVAQKLNNLRTTMILFAIGLIACYGVAIFSDAISFSTCLGLLSVGSFFAGVNVLAFTVSNNIMPDEYAGTGTGFMNTIVMASGVVFQPLLGMLLDVFRNGRVNADGTPLYTILNYRSALVFVIISLLIALGAVILVKEHDINPVGKEE